MNSISRLLSIRSVLPCLAQKSHIHLSHSAKSTQFYPIDDDLYQLNDEQKQVKNQTIELTPNRTYTKCLHHLFCDSLGKLFSILPKKRSRPRRKRSIK